jgi:nucleoside-diphosphate-sugar epimerase
MKADRATVRKGHFNTAADVVDADLEHILTVAAEELEILAGKHVLVTGGAGFLGYYLVGALLECNNRREPARRTHVTVLDNYARGVPAWLRQWEGEPRLTLAKHDIREPLPADVGRADFIVHAAGIASPTFYREHPIETMDANVVGLRRLLDRCLTERERGRSIDGFLFFSSSEIYGDPAPDAIPTPETYRGNVSCTGPRACYDESKRYGETLCVNFAREHGLPITIARPFNNYGPGLKITDRRLIPDLARDVLGGRDITLFSDGSATRTFCYSADAVVGYLKVLTRGRAGEPYNIGSEGPEISVADFAERVAAAARRLFDYRGAIVHAQSAEANYLVDNPNRRRPLIDKARTELGFEPLVDLDDGLERSLIWYTGNLEGEEA